MKYLTIIGRYSCVFFLFFGILKGQDLEDDFSNVVSRDIDTSVDYSAEEQALDLLLATYDISDRDKSRSAPKQPDLVKAKREQLSIVVRRAYYQKLTTPRWASILSAKDWRGSFLKWRYFAQLRNYILDLDNDLTHFKMTTPVEVAPKLDIVEVEKDERELGDSVIIHADDGLTTIFSEAARKEVIAIAMPEKVIPEKDTEENEVSENVKKQTEDTIVTKEMTSTSRETVTEKMEKGLAEEVPSHIVEETNEEEWEKVKGNIYSFTIAELTLPQGITSERPVVSSTVLMEIDSVLLDSLKNEEISMALAMDDELEVPKKEESIQKRTEEVVTKNREKKPKKKPKRKVNKPIEKKITTEKQSYATNQPVLTKAITTNTNSTAPTSISAGRRAQTAGFTARKGQLSWPVMSGSVTERYGIRANAAARGLKPRNNGVDMSCPAGTSVLSVHSGTVMMVSRQASYDHVVTIKHGDFTSAYYYINRPSVNVGDVVSIGQRLGRLIGGDGETRFHFEIWDGSNRVNPELWLQRK